MSANAQDVRHADGATARTAAAGADCQSVRALLTFRQSLTGRTDSATMRSRDLARAGGLMRPRLTSTTVGLALGITVAASIAAASGAYLYSLRHSDTLLETARRDALAQSELIRGALEHAMLEDDRSLIARMIRTFGREPHVVNVMLLDRTGKVAYTARPVAGRLDLESPTCQACHRLPPASRATSRVLDAAGNGILRTVVPIRNRSECHRCHDAGHAINGVLISDLDTTPIHAAAARDLRWMIGVTAAITIVLVAVLGLVVRLLLLRRLQQFETTARQIAQGDLTRRVPVKGSDTISCLEREFNTMADSVSSLVAQVQGERERLETIINSIEDGIVVLDADRKVVAANTAFVARFGASRDELLGGSCRHGGAGACAVTDCPTVACLQSGQPQIRLCERHTRDGTVAWEEVHAAPVTRLPDGNVHVVEVWRDISERRAAEARLAESHKLASLGLLASGFSHELNTPLGTVLACVEGIGRETTRAGESPDWAYVRDNAAIAREQVLRCRGITQQFLRMSHGDPSVAQVVDISDAIAMAMRLVAPLASERGARLLEDSPAACRLRVKVSESDLQHALINLLINALQACPADGTVRVRASAEGAGVRIDVSDTGCGIAAEHQAHIFEPFFSLRSGGTGLGLFLSKSFVRHWGGDILVRSAVGHGSTFSIVLPAIGESVESIPA
jgi:PAS domain S-box-containing protein